MKAIKITNPLYIGALGEHIQKYVKRVAPVGITYESLFTYFTQVVQFGGVMSEFYVCFDDENQPAGFASYAVLGLPYISTALFEHFYVWSKDKTTASVLLEEYCNFMKTHNCIYFKAFPRNDGMIEYIKKVAGKFDIEITDVKNGSIIGRRVK